MIDKYKYTEKELNHILSSIVIIVDTREKVNNHVLEWFDKNKVNHISKKLDQGDYSCYIPQNKELNIDRDLYFDKSICIERKANLDELAGNFTKDRERIKHEFAQYNGQMTLLIEENTYYDVCNGNYRSNYAAKSFMGTLHSIKEKYNVPFVFINKECSGMYIYYSMYYHIRNLFK